MADSSENPKRYRLTPAGAAILQQKEAARRQEVRDRMLAALEAVNEMLCTHGKAKREITRAELETLRREHIFPALNLARKH